MNAVKLLVAIFVVNLFAIAGAVYAFAPTYNSYQNLELKKVSIQKPNSDMPNLIIGKPVRLIIPSAKIDIEVIDGSYNSVTKNWTLSDDKAHFALMSSEANNMAGNTFIYGHNSRKVFAPLYRAKLGDIATVKTGNGKTFNYKLLYTKEVSPEDVSVFEYKGKSILTIQTCKGSWYDKRKLFIFEFAGVN